jgi:hypothetical protein
MDNLQQYRQNNENIKDIAYILRLAITGKITGLGLWDTMAILGEKLLLIELINL